MLSSDNDKPLFLKCIELWMNFVCNQDETCECVFFCFVFFVFIICFNCIFRHSWNLTGDLYWVISGSGNSSKQHRRPFLGTFFEGSWPTIQPPSSSDGEAAQGGDSDWWSNLLAAEGSLHSIIQCEEVSMPSRFKGLWVLGSKHSSVEIKISLFLRAEPHSRLAGCCLKGWCHAFGCHPSGSEKRSSALYAVIALYNAAWTWLDKAAL